MLVNISAIVVTYLCCLIAPLIIGIPIGVGARIFKYEILPDSVTLRLIFTIAGTVGAVITDLVYRGFGQLLPWWPFVVTAVAFILIGSRPTSDLNGRSMTFGAANGIFIFLLLRWLAWS